MPIDDFNTWIDQPRGGRWIKLTNPGDILKGELVDIDLINRTTPDGEIVLGKKSGKPRKVARVTVRVTPEDADDDGIRIFDANEAAQAALRTAGRLEQGGTIAITIDQAAPDKFSQATYRCQFKPGTTARSTVDDLI